MSQPPKSSDVSHLPALGSGSLLHDPVPTKNSERAEKPKNFELGHRSVVSMPNFERSIVSMLARLLRGRAVVELENLALRHRLHVLRRQRPGQPRLFTIDRLLWVWLYRLWPVATENLVRSEGVL
jgi:hypothetical protein